MLDKLFIFRTLVAPSSDAASARLRSSMESNGARIGTVSKLSSVIHFVPLRIASTAMRSRSRETRTVIPSDRFKIAVRT